MSEKTQQLSLMVGEEKQTDQPVTCLGQIFDSEEARRAHFTEELRKKLPELRKMEGFPMGEDEDILALSDPPYYTACPNPFIPEIMKEWEEERKAKEREPAGEYHREPFAADVSEGKNDPIYNAHSYHTKVPHKAIMRYILHYTEPGDVVFDGFAGTGMTGVAAQLCGDRSTVESLGYQVREDGTILDETGKPFSKLGVRKAILNDLSPAATFIAYNYNTPVDAEAFKREAERILEEVEQECGWMYETRHMIDGVPQVDEDGKPVIGQINYTVWSDVFVCPECTEEIVFWEAAVDQEEGKVKKEFPCPGCGAELNKRKVERAWATHYDAAIGETIRQAKQVPVLINYRVGKKRFEKRPDDWDLELIKKIEESEIPYWYPKNELPFGYNTQQPMKSHGVTHVHHFYSKRALMTLSKAYHLVFHSKYPIRSYLLYTVQQAVLGMAKISRYAPTHFSQVNRYLSGTLYIGSQIVDVSLKYILRGKINRLTKLLESNLFPQGQALVETNSLSNCGIDSHSIDYIFIDPPFGANIMYSELNFLWESWLKVFTNNKPEAIENKSQGKTLDDYRKLMTDCFREAYRVLKPGRWMTVEFSNSQASVWNTIQLALQEAGFIVAHVAALDKKQGSFKAVTTSVAVKQDLVISAYKPTEEMAQNLQQTAGTERSVWEFVKGHLAQKAPFLGKKGEVQIDMERTPRVLFDRMVAYHVQRGYPVPLSSGEFQAEVAQRFPMRDGMVFLDNQVAEYDKQRILAKAFVQMNLFVSDENSAIEWLRQQLMKKPQTRQDLHPYFTKEIQYLAKHEILPELDDLLEQNFLRYLGEGPVPSQIHTYLSKNYSDLRNRDKEDPELIAKAKERWYVPDPNKQADLEKLREKSLLREFNRYVEELEGSRKKLRQFRTEAIRAGFEKAWDEKDYERIVKVGERLPEKVLQEEEKLLRYFDHAQIRLGI
ncbi:DNA methyltransferase [Kroppenstedtia eburnea]|uniref:DNA methyltransferase n=1 Tax=Kroppenstedtia eburnea TaxID=714067 RepID=UPI003624F1CA